MLLNIKCVTTITPNIVRVIKSRRMRYTGYVVRMVEERGVYRFLNLGKQVCNTLFLLRFKFYDVSHVQPAWLWHLVWYISSNGDISVSFTKKILQQAGLPINPLQLEYNSFRNLPYRWHIVAANFEAVACAQYVCELYNSSKAHLPQF